MGFVGTWPLLPALLVTVAGFIIVAIIGSHVSTRCIGRQALESDTDSKGMVLSIIGVLYAVLLGFVAIGVWERFDQAEVRTYDEAADLQEVYRDAEMFPERNDICVLLRKYTKDIVEYDWTAMAQSAQAPHTRINVERLALRIRHLPVHTPQEQNVQQQMLEAFRSALEDRDTRMSMEATGLNPIMWSVLFLGAMLTVTFSYVLGFRHTMSRLFVIGSLGAMIGLVLYLTMSLDFPFRGAVRITPEAFTHALYNYDLIDQSR